MEMRAKKVKMEPGRMLNSQTDMAVTRVRA